MNENKTFNRHAFYLLLFAVIHDMYYVFFNNPGGFSFNKVIFFAAFFYFLNIQNKKFLFQNIKGYNRFILFSFLLFCLISFSRGIFTSIVENRIQNSLNPVFSLSVIVPFALFISFHPKFSFDIIIKISLLFIRIGILLLPAVFLFERGYVIPRYFIEFSFFMLIFLKIVDKKSERFWIILGCILYGFIGIYSDNRSIVLRLILQTSFLFMFTYGEQLFKTRILQKFVTFLCIVLPIIFYSYYGSFFQKESLSFGSKEVSNEDTRTYMYVEVIGDLRKTGNMLMGKGTLGRYYSEWFYTQKGVDDVVDFYDRSIVEVGILSYLLRGGLVLSVLFILVIFSASVTNLSSPDIVARGIAYILLNHLLLSFIENIPKFYAYDIAIWIMVGYNIRSKLIKPQKINTPVMEKAHVLQTY
ncbi:hypothetical protein [Spirosoma utsteinense]|uniref:Uncharacterized protein n=1 Tax=Spirosoma utsteinense TaxID=2585773 RepID=A0ABR6W8Z7_9BACT|nr:hypothetical protein [Spirosoma utsteinense]MBC3787410.1 hypothetical protein [Spirosoma utsteinense]MBC3793035.1 hypothetical protein [Spirosoma utsteinense]